MFGRRSMTKCGRASVLRSYILYYQCIYRLFNKYLNCSCFHSSENSENSYNSLILYAKCGWSLLLELTCWRCWPYASVNVKSRWMICQHMKVVELILVGFSSTILLVIWYQQVEKNTKNIQFAQIPTFSCSLRMKACVFSFKVAESLELLYCFLQLYQPLLCCSIAQYQLKVSLQPKRPRNQYVCSQAPLTKRMPLGKHSATAQSY